MSFNNQDTTITTLDSVRALTKSRKVLHRFRCNPLTTFDDDLKRDLDYAWSLPAHPTFEKKMNLIAAAIDEAALSPLHGYPNSQIFYFKRKIRDVVRERIAIYCLQVEAVSSAKFHSDVESEVDDSALPPLVDLSLE